MEWTGKTSGKAQWWLQTRKHYWPAQWLGNGVSMLRYWVWRLATSEGRRAE